jgi:hypothetical protein
MHGRRVFAPTAHAVTLPRDGGHRCCVSRAVRAEGLSEFLQKEDQRVLAADLRRTRQTYAAFKTQEVQVK